MIAAGGSLVLGALPLGPLLLGPPPPGAPAWRSRPVPCRVIKAQLSLRVVH